MQFDPTSDWVSEASIAPAEVMLKNKDPLSQWRIQHGCYGCYSTRNIEKEANSTRNITPALFSDLIGNRIDWKIATKISFALRAHL